MVSGSSGAGEGESGSIGASRATTRRRSIGALSQIVLESSAAALPLRTARCGAGTARGVSILPLTALFPWRER